MVKKKSRSKKHSKKHKTSNPTDPNDDDASPSPYENDELRSSEVAHAAEETEESKNGKEEGNIVENGEEGKNEPGSSKDEADHDLVEEPAEKPGNGVKDSTKRDIISNDSPPVEEYPTSGIADITPEIFEEDLDQAAEIPNKESVSDPPAKLETAGEPVLEVPTKLSVNDKMAKENNTDQEAISKRPEEYAESNSETPVVAYKPKASGITEELKSLPKDKAAIPTESQQKSAKESSFTDTPECANACIKEGDSIKSGGDVVKESEAIPNGSNSDLSEVKLKKALTVEKKDIEPTHESFTEIVLKQSEHGDTIKSGGDVVKEPEATQNASISDLSEVQLKKAPAVEKKDIEPLHASFTEIALKHSEHGDTIKSGGDVVKESEAIPNGSISDLSEVQLKKAPTVEKKDIEPLHASFSEIALKHSEHGDSIKSGGDVVKKPDFPHSSSISDLSEVQLKKAPAVEKKDTEPLHASFSEIALKHSEHGDTIKSGGDVVKEPEAIRNASISDFSEVQLKKTPTVEKKDIEPLHASFTEIALKQPEHGDTIKHGEDVVIDIENLASESTASFTEIHLKEAASLVKPLAEPRRISYIDVALKASESGEAIKSGKEPVKNVLVSPGKRHVEGNELGPTTEERQVMKECGAVVHESGIEVYGSVSQFSANKLKKAKLTGKTDVAVSMAPHTEVKLKKSGQGEALKAGGDPVKLHISSINERISPAPVTKPAKASSEEAGKPAFSCFSLKSTGRKEKLMPDADTTKIALIKPKPADANELPKAPAFAGFQLKRTGKASDLMPDAMIPIKSEIKEFTSEEKSSELANAANPDTAPSKPVFAGFKLKSTGKANELLQKELDKASKQAERNLEPHIPVMTGTSKPLFDGFKLKSTGKSDIIRNGGDVKQVSTAQGGKTSSAKTKSVGQPAYAGFKLKSTGGVDAMKTGGDAEKEPVSMTKPIASAPIDGEPGKPAFAGFKLKKVTPTKKLEDSKDSQSAPDVDLMRASTDVPKDHRKEEVSTNKPAFAGFQLKSTGHADKIKSGGDVVKSSVKGEIEIGRTEAPYASVSLKKALPDLKAKASNGSGTTEGAYTSVHLKKATPKPAVEPDEEKQGSEGTFPSVQLKKATPKSVVSDADNDDDETTANCAFSSVQLKKTEPNPINIGSLPSKQQPLYANTKLKSAAPPIEKPTNQRASYAEVQLKATGQGDDNNLLKAEVDVEVGHEGAEIVRSGAEDMDRSQ